MLNFNFVMIYIIHKLLRKKNFFSQHNDGKLKPWRKKYCQRYKKSFSTKKLTKTIKERTLRNIKNLFEHEEEESYYKLVRVSNFWSNNYMEHESNDDRNKKL